MPTLSLNGATDTDDGCTTPGAFLASGLGGRNLVGLYSGSFPMSMWYRFPNVTVPQGSTVNTAYLQLVYNSYSGADVKLNIYGDKATNSSAPTSDADYPARTRTTANSGTWTLGAPGANATIQSPSLVGVLTEIFAQGGWASGNALTLLCDYVTSTHSGQIDDFDTGTKPLLFIDYTAGGGGGGAGQPTVSRLHANGYLPSLGWQRGLGFTGNM